MRIADRLTVDLGRFLRLRYRGGDSVVTAARAFPQIAEAFCLQQDQRLIDSLRIMILGELGSAEIVARTGLTKKAIGLWQAIFFDVDLAEDPLGWHVNHIVWPELDAGNLQVASNLHNALCLGPHAARRLLDGPSLVPTDAQEYAKMVRVQAQIATIGLLLAPVPCRQELQDLQNLALKMSLQEQNLALAEKRLASRLAKEERGHALAERRVRIAEQQVKAAAERRDARAKAKADESAENEQLRRWHREQAAAQAQREHSQRRARIAASKLLNIPWGNVQQTQGTVRAADHASSAGPPLVDRPSLPPRSPGAPSKCTKRGASGTPKVALAAAEVAGAPGSSLIVLQTMSP